jgi:hypothetical protein
MEGVAGISRPPPTALSGERANSRSLILPSGGIRPPPSEGSKGGEVPQLHRPLFSLNGQRPLALHDNAGRAMVMESRLP